MLVRLYDWEPTIQQIVDEITREQNEVRKHKILIEWRIKLGKEPTLLPPYQIDRIVREARRRLGNASR
jgi:hypothetical protein